MDGTTLANISLENDINPVGQPALRCLEALQPRVNKESVDLKLDLAALCRTLVILSRRLHNGYTFGTSDTQNVKSQLQAIQSIFVIQGQSAAQLESSIAAISFAINRVIAVTKYIFALPLGYMHYPWGDIVQRIIEKDKYDLRSNCVLETDTELANRASIERALWEAMPNLGRHVHEHVGRLDGGERMYDPFFLSRSRDEARDFLTPGRVFAMLWSTDGYEAISHGVAHYDYQIEVDRYRMMGLEGFYTGPYEGPTTVRHFLVIRAGESSVLCLSIVTLPYPDPDRRRYVRMTMATSQSQYVEGIQIQAVPKPDYVPGPKRNLDIPPPHLLPTSDLPLPYSGNIPPSLTEALTGGPKKPFIQAMDDSERQRIIPLIDRKLYVDLKRIVEVESSVKARNVGIIGESVAWTEVKAMFAALSD